MRKRWAGARRSREGVLGKSKICCSGAKSSPSGRVMQELVFQDFWQEHCQTPVDTVALCAHP